jgi:uncharacterized membrane protein YgcG
MRRAFADFSPAVPAAFAAGLGVSLWIFLLPAGVVQKGPTSVLPFGGAAGRVVADLPVAGGRASVVRKAVSAHPQIVVALRPPTAKGREVHPRARTVVVPRAPLAPARAAAPAAPTTPVTKSQLFSMPPKAKGKARGHAKPRASTLIPHSPGHREALGRSNEHEDRVPPGQAKKASPASAPGRPAPPKGSGDGNGRKGNGGGNGGRSNGGGNGGKSNGGGNGSKLGWEKN